MIVLTTLLTSTPDPQRGSTWECDPDLVEMLAASIEANATSPTMLVVLYEGEPTRFVPHNGKVFWEQARFPNGRHVNPYFARWQAYASCIWGWDHVDFLHGFDRSPVWDGEVWCVDATDVELLRQPHSTPSPTAERPVIFAGSEAGTLSSGPGSAWLEDNHPSVRGFATAFPDRPLYNAGILGGDFRQVERVARSLVRLANDADLTDMAAFNLVMHTWPIEPITGDPVHTVFRAEEREHPTAWWRHK